MTSARRPGFALRRILRITAEGSPRAFDLSTECTRVLTGPIPTFLKAHTKDEIAALIAATIVSRALVSVNSTINLPLPADFCCNWTRTSGVLKTSLTTDNSGGVAGAALPFPSSVLRTKASLARTERLRSATQRASRPRSASRVSHAEGLGVHQRHHLSGQVE